MIFLKSRYLFLIAAASLFAVHNGSYNFLQGQTASQQHNKHLQVPVTFCESRDISSCVSARLRIWDGDTFIIDQPAAASLKIRIENIDAPEINGKCRSEIDRAQAAKHQLAAMLSNRRLTLIKSHLDRYNRQLAVVLADGVDVGAALVASGNARIWDGRRRPWC